MKLSIITINYNNAAGLQKTMQSVLSQTSNDFEYIVVDGDAPLNPPDRGTIESFVGQYGKKENGFQSCVWSSPNGGVGGGFFSEKDNGIYHAMNKGIQMAKGEYVQFLNSGDALVLDDVTAKMLSFLNSPPSGELEGVFILYGNMLKQLPKGLLRDNGFAGRQPTMLDFYTGTLNHSPAYIKRSLFDEYGLYDETLKICSDFKWYINTIIVGGVNPTYVDFDVTLFDMTGISTVNRSLDKQERLQVMRELLPEKVIQDYRRYAFPINQWERIQRYKVLAKLFWLLERILFKFEKMKKKMKCELK